MNYEYYYNNVPEYGLCRNNLIYTSLISQDKKVFVQHYVNDSEYHRGLNQVDPDKMTEKWARELIFLNHMNLYAPEYIPEILDVDILNKKIYLKIDGVDFWERAGCKTENYDQVLPDWQEQMLSILKKHRELGLYKYSLHPSSYFIVDGQLKSINYFFAYMFDEDPITINSILSHVSDARQIELKKQSELLDIDWAVPTALKDIQLLAFESFSNNYPAEFINRARAIYV